MMKLAQAGIISFGEVSEKGEGKSVSDAFDTFKTVKQCKVCTSPNRTKYEEYYLAVRDIPQVWALSKELGEDISVRAFYRHFQNHFNPDQAVAEQSKQLFQRAVEEKINYAQKLAQNFLHLDRLAGILLERLEKALGRGGEINTKELLALRTILPELRQVVREIRQLEGEDEG